MKKCHSFCIVALMLICLTACRQKPLWNPGTVSVQTQSREHMRNAIGQALRNRGWAISNEAPGHIEATLYARAHVAKVAIEYDENQFTVSYLDSQNLEYNQKPDGAEFIHGSYNHWVENLVRDISVFASHTG